MLTLRFYTICRSKVASQAIGLNLRHTDWRLVSYLVCWGLLARREAPLLRCSSLGGCSLVEYARVAQDRLHGHVTFLDYSFILI